LRAFNARKCTSSANPGASGFSWTGAFTSNKCSSLPRHPPLPLLFPFWPFVVVEKNR